MKSFWRPLHFVKRRLKKVWTLSCFGWGHFYKSIFEWCHESRLKVNKTYNNHRNIFESTFGKLLQRLKKEKSYEDLDPLLGLQGEPRICERSWKYKAISQK